MRIGSLQCGPIPAQVSKLSICGLVDRFAQFFDWAVCFVFKAHADNESDDHCGGDDPADDDWLHRSAQLEFNICVRVSLKVTSIKNMLSMSNERRLAADCSIASEAKQRCCRRQSLNEGKDKRIGTTSKLSGFCRALKKTARTAYPAFDGANCAAL